MKASRSPSTRSSSSPMLFARGYRTTWADTRRRDASAWRGRDGRSHVACVRWFDREALALRFCIDISRTRLTKRAREELGERVVCPGPPRPGLRDDHLRGWVDPSNDGAEQTCHVSELRDVAEWLARWVDARDQRPPAPPVPWTTTSPGWGYGWSRLAATEWELHRRADLALRAPRRTWATA